MVKKEPLNSVVSTYFKKYLVIDPLVVNKVLDSMFISYKGDFNKLSFSVDDFILLNQIIDFLSNYHGDSLKNDYIEYTNKLDIRFSKEFYIYFLFLYVDLCKNDGNIFNISFLNNLYNLFYDNDIEYLFNKEKFRVHFKEAYTGDMDLNDTVSDDLRRCVYGNLPKSLDNDLERSIAVYMILCKVLRYNPSFTISRDLNRTSHYSLVDTKHNEVTCVQFSIIYYKILKEMGIDANLGGDIHDHMYVNVSCGTIMFIADATMSGYYTDSYTISDITKLKYGFEIEGLYIAASCYKDSNYIQYNRARLNNSIKNVSRKLKYKNSLEKKVDKAISLFRRSEGSLEVVDYPVIERRINLLNALYFRVGSDVEDIQYFNKLVNGIFLDIHDDRVEALSLYKKVKDEVILEKVLVIYDEELKPYYYMFIDGHFVYLSLDQVINKIVDEGWNFKHLTDIDALDNEDERLLALVM